MLRKILGVIIGVVAGIVVVDLMEMVTHNFFPVPENIDVTNLAQLKEYVKTLPSEELALIVLDHAVGTFVATMIAMIVAGRTEKPVGYVAGGMLVLASALNLILLPVHPLWMNVLDILLPLLIMLLVVWKFGKKKYNQD